MRNFSFAIVGLLLALAPVEVLAWGSLSGFETHQFILNAAYDLLEKDPAFDGGTFPRRAKILDNEGVYWSGEGQDNILRGPGPDSDGASPDSDHYYNPLTKKGTAPQAAAKWLKLLAMSSAMVVIGETTPSDFRAKTAKEAAWGAHFLADMGVYYHLNGIPLEEAEAAWAKDYDSLTGLRLGPVLLRAEETGDLAKLSWRLKPQHTADFTLEMRRFLTVARKPENKHKNFFDPWYWNGNTDYDAYVLSTHLMWEQALLHNVMPAYALKGFNSRWKNSEPDFFRATEDFERNAEKYARGSARATLDTLCDAAVGGIESRDRSIQDVYTLWRATQTGLRCGLQADSGSVADGTEPVFDQDGKMTLRVRALVGNLAGEDASNVRVRLVPCDGAEIIEGAPIQTCGLLPGGVRDPKFFGDWTVRVTKKNIVLVEVIGSYSNTPDFQYYGVTGKLVDVPDVYRGAISGDAEGEFVLEIKDNTEYRATIKGTSNLGRPFEASGGGKLLSPTSFQCRSTFTFQTVEIMGGVVGVLFDKEKKVWKGNWSTEDTWVPEGDGKKYRISGTFVVLPSTKENGLGLAKELRFPAVRPTPPRDASIVSSSASKSAPVTIREKWDQEQTEQMEAWKAEQKKKIEQFRKGN